jgi:hypothetical protein
MPWATAEQAQEITGTEVTAEQLAQADGIITLYAGRTPDSVERLRTRDVYWLRAAVAWQAAWLASNVGVAGRNLATRVDTEGLSVDHAAEYELVLAPLAARALRNLSWKGDRSVLSRPLVERRGMIHNPLLEESDQYATWQPL